MTQASRSDASAAEVGRKRPALNLSLCTMHLQGNCTSGLQKWREPGGAPRRLERPLRCRCTCTGGCTNR
jgi:hypothetical protein